MAVQALGYITNNGDGSSSIQWIRGEDQEDWEVYVQEHQFAAYNDGDGLTLRETLNFPTYFDAEVTGIIFHTKDEWYGY
jgi:hypothetical protein